MLERLIAHYCGPALAGIKPANIASCTIKQISDIHQEIDRLNNQLNVKDIYIEILCECDKRVLIMLYRKKVLEKHLQAVEMKDFLSSFGYPQSCSAAEYIDYLKTRMDMDNFPHEIGAFLGYPLHDIYGFINHRDDGCLLIGEWKVYKDAESAQKLFSRYTACRKAIVNRLVSGFTLAQIFCAV